jgi:hypothetical protein
MPYKVTPILVISIDCECDKSLDWRASDPLSFHSITHAIPRVLQALCNKYGAVPTYLLSNEVIEDSACVQSLTALDGAHELGTHLHGDYVDPMRKYSRYDGTLSADYQSDYDDPVQQQKMERLTQLFISRFGYHPTSFRAGRFGANSCTVRTLEKLKYKADSSVLPGLREKTPGGAINFSKAPVGPYFPSPEDICVPGDCSVLEVPVSVWQNPIMKRLFAGQTVRSPKPLSERVFGKIFPSSVVRPTFYSAQDMIKTADRLMSSRKTWVINMMFHSMELVPRASPYVTNEVQARRLLKRIEIFLKWWKDKGYQFSSLSSLYNNREGVREARN